MNKIINCNNITLSLNVLNFLKLKINKLTDSTTISYFGKNNVIYLFASRLIKENKNIIKQSNDKQILFSFNVMFDSINYEFECLYSYDIDLISIYNIKEN